ncbi:MAG TPA: hypothetical protein VHH12_12470, partial [Mycobacterium sp.]|nr:hypothetical protein [Mycobacterium sp.]
RGIDPTTGHYFDDTKRYVDALPISDEQRHAIFEGNARRVFPRLDARLKERGADRRTPAPVRRAGPLAAVADRRALR